MRTFAFVFFLLLAARALANGEAGGYAQPVTENYSQRDLLKNWAFSVCLATVISDPMSKADATATASAYMEYGRQGLEAYDELRKLAEKYAAKRYRGSIPSEFNTMKCIDLFHSAELNRLAAKLAKTR